MQLPPGMQFNPQAQFYQQMPPQQFRHQYQPHPQQYYYQQPPIPQQYTNLPPNVPTQTVSQPPLVSQQQQVSAPVTAPESAPAPAPVAVATESIAKPAQVPQPVVENQINDLSNNLSEKLTTKPEEPSVEIEKSAAPSVSTIKEDEEWEDKEVGEDASGEKGADEEVAKPKKKELVIREYKAKKEPINVIFCGHVDAGKSTIGGQIMYQTGMVDKRTLEKYEREAKEKNRESWYLSWALDTNIEKKKVKQLKWVVHFLKPRKNILSFWTPRVTEVLYLT